MTSGEKPPTQILGQSETFQNEQKFYSPSLTWKIFEYVLDNRIPHVLGLIAGFILSFVVPLYVDTALGVTAGVVGFLGSFVLGATLEMYDTTNIEIWRHWFRLKR